MGHDWHAGMMDQRPNVHCILYERRHGVLAFHDECIFLHGVGSTVFFHRQLIFILLPCFLHASFGVGLLMVACLVFFSKSRVIIYLLGLVPQMLVMLAVLRAPLATLP